MSGIVKIDDEVFTSGDFVKLLKLNGRFENLMEEVLRDKLAVHAAKKRGIQLPEEEVQEKADQFRRVHGLHRAKETNEYFDAFENRDLLLNTISWLLGDVEHIAVRPNVARSSNVALTARQFQAIQYFSLLVLPEGIALLGVLTWWSRRRSTGP